MTTESGHGAGGNGDPGGPLPRLSESPTTGGEPSRDERSTGGHRAGDGDRGAGEAAAPTGPGRRQTVVLRYLLGRLAIDHLRRLTVWTPAVPVLGAVLLLFRPRWVGLAVLALGVLLVAARVAAVRQLDRLSLPHRFRPVEDDLRDAVEAGKANLRVELRRVGLPSRSWHVPVFALRLARGTGREAARGRLRDVDLDLVLPRAQLERALRVLDEASRS